MGGLLVCFTARAPIAGAPASGLTFRRRVGDGEKAISAGPYSSLRSRWAGGREWSWPISPSATPVSEIALTLAPTPPSGACARQGWPAGRGETSIPAMPGGLDFQQTSPPSDRPYPRPSRLIHFAQK